MITDQQMNQAMHAWQALTPEQRTPERQDALRSTMQRFQQQREQQQREDAERRELTLERYFTRDDRGLAPERLDAVRAPLRRVRDPESAEMALFNDELLTARGIPRDALRDMRRPAMRELARQTWGFDGESIDDRQFYEGMRSTYQLRDDILHRAQLAVATGRPPEQEWGARVAELRQHPGWHPDREQEYAEAYMARANAEAELLGPHGDTVNAIFAEAERATGLAEGEGDLDDAAVRLMEVPEEHRDAVLRALYFRAEDRGWDPKGMLHKLGETMGRRLGELFGRDLPRGWNRAQLMNAQRLLDILGESERGSEVLMSEALQVLRDFGPEGEAIESLVTREGTVGPVSMDDATRRQTLERVEQALDLMDMEDQVREFAHHGLDRIERDNILQTSILGVTDTLPYLLVSLVPPGMVLNAASHAQYSYTRLQQMNPDMDRRTAMNIATAVAPFQVAGDRLGGEMVIGRLPRFREVIGQVTGSVTGRYGTRTIAILGAEMAIENYQDLAPFIGQQMIRALSEDVPDVPWAEVLEQTFSAENQLELFAVILPLALIGAGAGRLQDIRGGRQLMSDPLALQAAGFDDAAIHRITRAAEAGDWGTAVAEVRREFAGIDFQSPDVQQRRDDAATIIREQANRVAAGVQQLTMSAQLPDMQRTDDGWRLVYQDTGATMDFKTYEDADRARWASEESRQLQLNAAVREAIRNSERNLAPGQARRFIFDARRMTVAERKADGDGRLAETLEERQRLQFLDDGRAEDAAFNDARARADAKAIDQETRDATTLILGESTVEFREGVYTGVARLYSGFDATTVVQETLEADARRLLREGKREWLTRAVRDLEQRTGDQWLPRDPAQVTDLALIEAFSHIGEAVFVGESVRGHQQLRQNQRWLRVLQNSLLGRVMEAVRAKFAAMFNRAEKLMAMRDAGQLDANLDLELSRALGLEQIQHDRAVLEDARALRDDTARIEDPMVWDDADLPAYREPTPEQQAAGEAFSLRRIEPQFIEDSGKSFDNLPPARQRELLAEADQQGREALGRLDAEGRIKDDGTVLAPNGKPSELYRTLLAEVGDPEQAARLYAMTHTPFFKRWFGDWEGAEMRRWIEGQPIVGLVGNEFPLDPHRRLSERVAEWYQNKFGDRVSRQDIGAVQLSPGIKPSWFHGRGRLKASAFAAVPEIIRKGRIVNRTLNYKGKRDVESIIIAAPLTIEDARYTGIVVVRKTDKTQRFFVHEVFVHDTKTPRTSSKAGDAAKSRVSTGADAEALSSIAGRLRSVNPETVSKVVDRNGEPLVVWHGAGDRGIASFEPGRHTGEEGIFFTDSKADAAEFSAMALLDGKPVVMPAFLRILDPVKKSFRGELYDTDLLPPLFRQAKEQGKDGVIARNIVNFEGGDPSTTFAPLRPNQIKSATGNQGTFSGSARIGFSLLPGELDARLARMFDPFQRSPELRRQLRLEMLRRIARAKGDWEQLAMDNRTVTSINREARTREAFAADRIEGEMIDDRLTPADHQALALENEASFRDSPVVRSILEELGPLMSRTEALRSGRVMSDGLRAGDYDGAPQLPSYLYGGRVMPDQAAQMLFDRGMIKDPTVDALWDALATAQRSSRNLLEAAKVAREKLRDIRRTARHEAKAEAERWKAQALHKARGKGPERQRLVRAMRTLDAILSALPAEVRARVGGYVQLARLDSDATRLKEIERRVEMIDRHLERWMKKDADRRMRALLKRAEPAKNEAGRKRVGKLGADVHALFDSVRQAIDQNPETVEGRIGGLEAEIMSGELSPQMEAHKTLEVSLLRLFGDWGHADAARRYAAVEAGQAVFERGYGDWQFRKLAERERRKSDRAALAAATGRKGVRAERTAQEKEAGLVGWLKKHAFALLNFEQITGWVFGKNSTVAQRLADMEREAAYRKEDAIQQAMEEIDDLFNRLAGSRLAGEQLHWDMAQRAIKTDAGEFSQLEAITATLMWRQADGRRHMEGHLDDAGKPVGKWHYDQAFVDQLEAALSPEAREVRSFLVDAYGAEYARLNPIYRELHGVDLPMNANYSPLTVKPVNEQVGQLLDPESGKVTQGAGGTPGALRTRSRTAVAEPDFRDALQTYIAHTRQMEHWMAYAHLSAEAHALLAHRDVGDAVRAKLGDQAQEVLRRWVNMFTAGGVQVQGRGLETIDMFQRMANRMATVAMVGRIGTLAIQYTQLAAAHAQMPTGAYLRGMGKLMTGQLGWREAFSSSYIQRRFKQGPPVIRQAVEGLKSAKPNRAKFHVAQIARLISGADALFTAGTYAIVRDYQMQQGRQMGLVGKDLEAYATNAAERATDRVAQPTRMGTRSLLELEATNPLWRLAWSFGSEPRKNLGLLIYSAAKGTTGEMARAAFYVMVMNALLGTLWRTAWMNARDDDSEAFDERYWNLKRLTLATATEPFHGFPILGEMAQGAMFTAFGEWRPEGNLFSPVGGAVVASTRIPEHLAGETDADQIMRDIDLLLSGMGIANDTVAAAASLSHLARDLYRVGANLADD